MELSDESTNRRTTMHPHHQQENCWEAACEIVGKVPRTEAEQSLMDRLRPIRQRLGRAGASNKTKENGEEDMGRFKGPEEQEQDLLGFLLSKEDSKKPGEVSTKKKTSDLKPAASKTKPLVTKISTNASFYNFRYDDSSSDDGTIRRKRTKGPLPKKQKAPFRFDTCDTDDATDDDSDVSLLESESDEESEDDDDGYNEVEPDFMKGLTRLLELGRDGCVEVVDERVVLLLGPTGAGKSLLINAIAGKRFRRKYNKDRQKLDYRVDGEKLEGFRIGQKFKSQTRRVRAYQRRETGTYYIDSSGFGDNQCEYADVATSLSVRDLARKCERLRIAVLVNAYTFYNDRGTHLRNLLDFVSQLVGNNFDECKTAFTFLFTHCRDAFRSTATRQDDEEETLRKHLIALLKSVREAEHDKDLCNLINFLRSSLKKRLPFCDIFEPDLSDVSKICRHLEPSQNYLLDPASTVQCALTPSSRTKLSDELNGRTKTVRDKLEDRCFDDELKETVGDVATLASFVDDDFCRAVVQEMTGQLKKARDILHGQLRDIVHDGAIASDPPVQFDPKDALLAKECLDGLDLLAGLIAACEDGVRSVEEDATGHPESQPSGAKAVDVWNSIEEILRRRADWIREECAKAKSYLAFRGNALDDGGSNPKPDFTAVRIVLQMLRAWQEVFEKAMEPVISEATKSALSCVVKAATALDSLKPESNAVLRADGCVRITAFLRDVRQSGLLDCFFGKTETGRQKFARLDQTAEEARRYAKDSLTDISNHLKELGREAFSAPVDLTVSTNELSAAARKYGQLLEFADYISSLVLDENLSEELDNPIPRPRLLEELMVTFRQHWIVCERLVAGLRPETAWCLQPCLYCLHRIASSLPSTLQTDGQFMEDLDELTQKITSALIITLKKVGRSVASATEDGVKGDIDTQLQHYRTLGAGSWYDMWLREHASPERTYEQLRTERFFESAYREASMRYKNHYEKLSKEMCGALDIVLSETSTGETIRENSRFLVASWDMLLASARFVEEDKVFQDTAVGLLSQLQEWCNLQQAEVNVAGDVARLSFDRVDRFLLVASCLEGVESFKQLPLQSMATSVKKELKSHSEAILQVIQDHNQMHEHAKLLDTSKKWSTFVFLRRHLPIYEQLKGLAKSRFHELAKRWLDYVKDAGEVTDVEVESVTEFVEHYCDADATLDSHLDGAMTSWAVTIAGALDMRMSDLDERFKSFVFDNEYDEVLECLSKLKGCPVGSRKFEVYQKSISVLANHWSCMFSMLRAMLGELRAEIIPDMTKLLETLEGAETKLGDVVGQVPDWNGTLSDEMTRFSEEISTNLSVALDRAGDASKDMEVGDAYSFLARAKMLKSLARQGEGESKFHDIQEAVEKLLPDIAHKVDRFLMSVSETNGDTTRKTSSQSPVEPELPDTTALLEALRKLKLAAEREDCADIVKDSYAQESKKLSEGISSLYDSLRQDIADLKLSRPKRLLAYLRDQMEVKGMKEHLAMEFDATLAMGELDEAESKQQGLMSSDMLEAAYVDEVARRLDALRIGGAVIYYCKQDYEKLRIEVTGFANDIVSEMEGMIKGNHFVGIRSRFAVITYVCAKLGKHFSFDCDPQRLVSDELSPRLSKVEADMKGYLEDDMIHHFDTAFTKSFALFEEIASEWGATNQSDSNGWFGDSSGWSSWLPGSFGIEGVKSEEKSLLDAYDSRCWTLRASLHEMMASRVETLVSEFQGQVDNLEFDSAAKMLTTINDLGNFLATSFQAYRLEYCLDVHEGHLEKLNGLIRTNFCEDFFLEFCRHLWVFGEPITASFDDIQGAYKKLEVSFTRSSNPSEQRRYKGIKNSWAYLSRNKGLFEVFQHREFTFVSRAISRIDRKVKVETESLIESCAFERLGQLYAKLSSLADLVGKLRDPSVLDPCSIRDGLINAVHAKLRDLQMALDRASLQNDFGSINHALAEMEDIEKVFAAELGPASYSSNALDDQRSRLLELRDTAARIDSTTDEKTAFLRLTDFGADLISIGRVMDGFDRLRREAEEILCRILDSVQRATWGASFIFNLGIKLESGKIVADEDGVRIGRMIVTTMPQFKDARIVEIISAPVGAIAGSTEVFSCGDDLEFVQESFDATFLTEAFRKYKLLYDNLFLEHVSDGPGKLVGVVFEAARKFGCGGVRAWGDSKRDVLIEILAGVFATFTILESGDSFNRIDEYGVSDIKKPSSLLFCPHNVQVTAVLRLLGIASPELAIENHVMEVRTGEGKSVILGALATVLAILGFEVRCVCHSESVGERNRDLFRNVFVAFGVESRIVYSKINTMSEASLSATRDIRQLTTDLIKRGKSPAGREVRKEASRRNKHEGPNELNGEDVLLVDEVDVFFGSDFYGETYKMVAQVDDPTVERLIRRIWDCRAENPTPSTVSCWPEHERVVAQFPVWRSLIEKEVRCMCSDVGDFNSPAYEVDAVNCRIGYKVMDSIDWRARHGYRTAFAFLNEQEQGTFSSRADLGSELSLRVSCGQFLYANVKPTLILGVSGTVHDLNKQERSIVREMGVFSFSVVPSVYGLSKLEFDVGGRGIVIEEEMGRYHQSIADRIKRATDKGGAALVFFEDDARLQAFRRCSHWRNIRNGLVLDSSTTRENCDYIVRKAATSRQVTIATAPFGRGTDFFTMDRNLEDSGGMVVVQTFLSCEKSEETQIKGRTARQGRKGSYVMVLLESDLCEKFGIEKREWATKARDELYAFLDEQRRLAHEETLERQTDKVKEAAGLDGDSRRFVDALTHGKEDEARTLLVNIYETMDERATSDDDSNDDDDDVDDDDDDDVDDDDDSDTKGTLFSGLRDDAAISLDGPAIVSLEHGPRDSSDDDTF